MQGSRCALIVSAIALCAAGCFADHGVAIEVDVGTTGATSVELYVGNSLCSDHQDATINCKQGIAPPMVSAHLQGTVWFRDDPVPYFAVVKDHKATFRLQADQPTTLPIAIAIGSKGRGSPAVGTATLRDVVVPAHAAHLLTTTLVTAGEIAPSTSRATEDRAEVWTQPDPAGSSCVVVEHWADGKAERDFIVPADDPDCDSIADECDPAASHGAIKDQGTDAPPACFVASNDSATEPCQLGAFGCSDDTGASTTCLSTREEICAPKRFCECHGPGSENACPRGKLADLPGTVPHLECTVRIAAIGACRDESEPINLQDHYGDVGCDQAALSAFQLDAVGSGRPSNDFGGTEIDLSNVIDPCAFSVRVRSGSHALLGNDQELGMIKLDAHGSAIVLPVVFQFVFAPVCEPKALLCTLHDVPDDSMWSCAQP